jgi:hypothetical protein
MVLDTHLGKPRCKNNQKVRQSFLRLHMGHDEVGLKIVIARYGTRIPSLGYQSMNTKK